DIDEISKILKERAILLHLDISHVFGKMEIDLSALQADFITLDGALIHGPRSSGLIWVKKGIKLDPFLMGGLDQGGHRGAPLDIALLTGLAEAVKESIDAIDYVSTETARLKRKFEKGIEKIGGKILFQDKNRLPHITAAVFPHIPNEALLYRLNKDNLFASMGGGNLQHIGFVLNALDVPDDESRSALSFALSRETSEEDIDRAIQLIERNVQELLKVTKSI
ncbi:MAG: aminotransferase class V-fold PLP-dependent enzyme, partial [Parachlamydiaceae bacterium]